MVEERESPGDTAARSALVHREIFQLAALIALAIVAFLVTRTIAISNRAMTLDDAAEWFHRGQLAMQAGHLDQAIESLRRASVRDRENSGYVLVLAEALARQRDYEGARGILIALRASSPEDREINLQLARLAVSRQDVTEAVRFYHNALYAPWPNELIGARRQVRIELARFLLSHGQSARAVAELLALSSDMPDEIALHLAIAQLFADADDQPHALDQFRRALRLDPGNRTAIAGAGEAAFSLGDYATARALLRRLPPDAGAGAATLALVDLVLSKDPLAARIGTTERRQRLVGALAYVDQRLQKCIDNGNRDAQATALATESRAFASELANTRTLEQDIVEAGVDLIDRLESELGQHCGVDLIDIRLLAPFAGPAKDYAPTKKGVSIALHLLPQLRAAVLEAERQAVQAGWLEVGE